MPIYRLLPHAAFEPEQIRAMGAAFEETLARLGLKDRTDPLVELVAKKIIELGQQGVRDAERLRDLTIRSLTT